LERECLNGTGDEVCYSDTSPACTSDEVSAELGTRLILRLWIFNEVPPGLETNDPTPGAPTRACKGERPRACDQWHGRIPVAGPLGGHEVIGDDVITHRTPEPPHVMLGDLRRGEEHGWLVEYFDRPTRCVARIGRVVGPDLFALEQNRKNPRWSEWHQSIGAITCGKKRHILSLWLAAVGWMCQP